MSEAIIAGILSCDAAVGAATIQCDPALGGRRRLRFAIAAKLKPPQTAHAPI
jgi:hypothetical protein